MKLLAWIVAVLGLVVVAYALVGRFHGPPTLVVPGLNIQSSASHVLQVADTLLLIAVFLATVGPGHKRP